MLLQLTTTLTQMVAVVPPANSKGMEMLRNCAIELLAKMFSFKVKKLLNSCSTGRPRGAVAGDADDNIHHAFNEREAIAEVTPVRHSVYSSEPFTPIGILKRS